MASNYKIQKRWIENFSKSPLVIKETKAFNKSFAQQLFFGRKGDSYPKNYPDGFKAFYDTHFDLDRFTAIDTALHYLNFIGIRLRKEAVLQHIEFTPTDYHKFLHKCYFIFRTLAYRSEHFNVTDPYVDNWGDISFLIRMETGQAQLSIFEDLELPELYNKYIKIPEGYEDDNVVTDLFNDIENTNQSFFITGKAGTGKSTFVHYFTQNTKKKVILSAFTGIAAMNVGGVTLHSFFKFPFKPLMPEDDEIAIFPETHEKRQIIADADTFVIDEISMLRSDLLQAIDYSLRNNGGDPDRVFGGKQIIFVGDVFQLPPVANSKEPEREIFSEVYKSPYFFDCTAYGELSPQYFEFTKSKRQKDDLEFVTLLDKVRECKVDSETLQKLNERFNANYVPKPEEFVITLATNNSIADAENERRLNALQFTSYEFHADVKGDFDEDRYPTHHILRLKKHAQVMFTKNDTSGERRWVNGTIGKIEFIAQDIIEVKLPNGKIYTVEKETWEHRGYQYDKSKRKVTSQAKGTFTSYPLKLAWAITIHKSQGLTFDNVIIDLGSGAFVNGQLYTALSRCRKLAGITLKRKIRSQDIIQDQRLLAFYKRCTDSSTTGRHGNNGSAKI